MAGPWEKYGGQSVAPAPQQAPARIYGAPPQMTPSQDASNAIAQQSLALREQREERMAQMAAAEEQRKQREFDMRMNPQAAPPTPAQFEERRGKATALDALVNQLNRVQSLYETGPGSTSGVAGVQDYFGTPTNSQFDAAGSGLVQQAFGAFRTPGQGSQSDADLRLLLEAQRPEAGNFDTTIEEKLRTLRNQVDVARSGLGLPAANWLGVGENTDPSLRPPGGNADENGVGVSTPLTSLGAGNNGGAGVQLGPQGAQQTLVDDPTLAGIRSAYLGRLRDNQAPGQIVQWLRNEVGITDPQVLKSAAAQAEFRRKNPNVPLSEYPTAQLGQKYEPLSDTGQALNILGQSAVGAGAIAAGDALTGFNLDSIIGATGGNAERARLGMQQNADNSPIASTVGTLAGGVAGAMIPEAALARAGLTGAGATLAADAAYGAVAGAGLTDYGANGAPATAGERLAGAATGAALGAGGSALGQGVARGAGAFARGVTNPSVRAVQDAGIPTTIGQSVGQSGFVGRAIKGVEDRLSGIPGVGDNIRSRQVEGIEKFNANQFDKALRPLGKTTEGRIGNDGIVVAQEAVAEAFDSALGGKQAQFDGAFANNIIDAVAEAQKIKGIDTAKFLDELNQVTQSQFDLAAGTLQGRDMQLLLQRLEGLKKNYKNEAASYEINAVINKVQSAAEGIFKRQAPEVIPAYNRAKAAYKRVSILEDAVLAANNADGVFSPAQLGRTQISNTKKYGGKRAAAAGVNPFQAEQRAAQNVLPNKVPDSGTAGRALVTAGLAGASGAGVGAAGGDAQSGLATGLGAIGILAALYSRGGQKALVGLTKPKTGKTQKALQAVSNRQNLLGAAGSVSALNALAQD